MLNMILNIRKAGQKSDYVCAARSASVFSPCAGSCAENHAVTVQKEKGKGR